MFTTENFLRFAQLEIKQFIIRQIIQGIPDDEQLQEAESMIRMRGQVVPVWYCKTLQNHKGLFICLGVKDKYFECTYNGDKGEMYIDVYEKKANECLVCEGIPVKEEVKE